jgi:phage terminase large subunit-like protein
VVRRNRGVALCGDLGHGHVWPSSWLKSASASYDDTKPIKIVRELLADPHTTVTRGSTYDNRANLAPSFLTQIVKKYEGTRLGRQELNAEVLEDTPGALWQRSVIEELRRTRRPENLKRTVVAVDPAVTSGEDADETGIVVCAIDSEDRGWVLADLSGRYQPHEWGRAAISAYHEWGADRVIAEVNNGGDLVESTLRMIDPNVSYRAVRASKGKFVRAEPVSALYEQRRVHHLGSFPNLEDQMCAFTVDFNRASMGYSPDRLDAMVWALSELMVTESTTGVLDYYRELRAQKEAVNGQRQPN